ncbi:MAG TPA: hypothetical protein PKB01_10645 [Xanthobacteraceae bacterium]|nr:hypothetical protein [Xanthobacteraceae bacterium]
MKLEYRGLSSSRRERLKRPGLSSFGFLDFLAASLLIFVLSWYFVAPSTIERVVDWVVYEPANNSFASLRCIDERTTQYQFTKSRDVTELKDSVRLVRYADLERYARPQPDAGCHAVRGFTDAVPRWEFYFGWLHEAPARLRVFARGTQFG